MNQKLAIIHTTPATIVPLKALASEMLPSYELANFVDDSILPQLARNGGNLRDVEDRWIHYARFAEQGGAQAILSACSSVGDIVPTAQHHVRIPIVRIDEAMAEEAVRRAEHIGVAATLPTTLDPTMRLLRGKAEAIGKRVRIEPMLAEAAYRRLIDGDQDGHDSVLAAALAELAKSVDIVVLAQASMARVVATFPESERHVFLSSPRSGMERVRLVLEGRR